MKLWVFDQKKVKHEVTKKLNTLLNPQDFSITEINLLKECKYFENQSFIKSEDGHSMSTDNDEIENDKINAIKS